MGEPTHADGGLVERLEKATGPDRSLDCDIFVATAESPFVSYYPDCVLATIGGFSARLEISDIKSYTASIDAALTLVPEGMEWCISNRGQIGAENLSFAGIYGDPFIGSECDTNAPTPTLALCIAALRAREAIRARTHPTAGEGE